MSWSVFQCKNVSIGGTTTYAACVEGPRIKQNTLSSAQCPSGEMVYISYNQNKLCCWSKYVMHIIIAHCTSVGFTQDYPNKWCRLIKSIKVKKFPIWNTCMNRLLCPIRMNSYIHTFVTALESTGNESCTTEIRSLWFSITASTIAACSSRSRTCWKRMMAMLSLLEYTIVYTSPNIQYMYIVKTVWWLLHAVILYPSGKHNNRRD